VSPLPTRALGRTFSNEALLGEALAPFRGRVVIATKFGFKIDPDGRRREGVDGRGSSRFPERPNCTGSRKTSERRRSS